MNHRKTLLLFTYILACVVLLVSDVSAQGIRESEFNGDTLDTFWRFVDPLGGCSAVPDSVTHKHLKFSVPAGPSRDPWPWNYQGQPANRSARLVQQVAPPGSDYGNFAVLVKFDSVMKSMYQIKGIQAIQNDSTFIRCEFFCDSTGSPGDSGRTLQLKAFLASIVNGGPGQNPGPVVLPLLPDTTRTLYLRLDRINSSFTLRYSTDGSSWTITSAITQAINIDSVGIHVASADPVNVASGNNAPAFKSYIDYFRTPVILPVQLSSFSAVLQANNLVRLNWTTITETNNYGFEVQKSLGSAQNFETIPGSFIPGHGTTLEPHHYSYVDVTTSPGTWYYRLKQIDLDGTVHYTEPIRISVLTEVGEYGKRMPTEFALDQNYPNPFNPSTVIRYEVPTETRVTLEVFNLIGQKVATIVDEVKPAGFYTRSFNASGLTSGVYMYKLAAGGRSFTRKMVLIK